MYLNRILSSVIKQLLKDLQLEHLKNEFKTELLSINQLFSYNTSFAMTFVSSFLLYIMNTMIGIYIVGSYTFKIILSIALSQSQSHVNILKHYLR